MATETDLTTALAELVGLLELEETFDETLQQLTETACRAMPRCASASVTLRERDCFSTPACSTKDSRELDMIQYDSGTGPCIDAIRQKEVVESNDLAVDERWPAMHEPARERGIHGLLCTPMVVKGEAIGGLNVYTEDFGPADDDTREVAGLVAALAGVAALNSRTYRASQSLAQQMQEAMASRAVIEQAKGVLMAEQSCTPNDAFDLLRRASQRENVKLRDIAQRIVDARMPGRGD